MNVLMMRIIVAAMSSTLCTFAIGEEVVDLRIPIKRYVRDNPDVPTLSYWAERISIEVSGDVNANIAFHAVSLVQTLSVHASIDVEMSGEPEYWFVPKNSIGPNSNYVILFDNTSPPSEANSGQFWGDQASAKFDLSNPKIRSLLKAGIPRRGEGCYANWSAKSDNSISAFVLVVDSGMSENFQKQCIDALVTSSFGVLSVVTALADSDMVVKNREDQHFYDKSEIIQLIRMSAFCRLWLDDYSLQCPADVQTNIYLHHEKLLRE